MEATQPDFFKTSCPKCGVNIEVPNELYDQVTNCPSCQADFLARPPVPVARIATLPNIPATKNRSKFWIAVSIFIAGTVLTLAVYTFHEIAGKFIGSTLGAIAIAIIAVFVLIWSVLWLLFPVFVYFGMNRMEELLKKIERNTRGH